METVAEKVMGISEAILIAIGQRPNGWVVLAFGSALCMATLVETMANPQHAYQVSRRFWSWAGRLFVIGVGLLMVVAGVLNLSR